MKYLSNSEISGFMKHVVRYNIIQLKAPKGDEFVSEILSKYENKVDKDEVKEEGVQIRKNGRLVNRSINHGLIKNFTNQISSLLK